MNLPYPEYGKTTTETIDNLMDTTIKFRKILEYSLQHLDETNIPSLTGIVGDISGAYTEISQTQEQISLVAVDVAENKSELIVQAGQISAVVSDVAGNTASIEIQSQAIQIAVQATINNANLISQNTTSIQLNSDEILLKAAQTEVDTLTGRVDTAESTITVMADSIELKVDVNGVISAINLSEEEITISANKIALDGIIALNGLVTVSDNIILGTAEDVEKQIKFVTGANIRNASDGLGGYTAIKISASTVSLTDGHTITNDITIMSGTYTGSMTIEQTANGVTTLSGETKVIISASSVEIPNLDISAFDFSVLEIDELKISKSDSNFHRLLSDYYDDLSIITTSNVIIDTPQSFLVKADSGASFRTSDFDYYFSPSQFSIGPLEYTKISFGVGELNLGNEIKMVAHLNSIDSVGYLRFYNDSANNKNVVRLQASTVSGSPIQYGLMVLAANDIEMYGDIAIDGDMAVDGNASFTKPIMMTRGAVTHEVTENLAKAVLSYDDTYAYILNPTATSLTIMRRNLLTGTLETSWKTLAYA